MVLNCLCQVLVGTFPIFPYEDLFVAKKMNTILLPNIQFIRLFRSGMLLTNDRTLERFPCCCLHSL